MVEQKAPRSVSWLFTPKKLAAKEIDESASVVVGLVPPGQPTGQDLQADRQQKNAYNPFSEKSKKMIKDMGNVELFELCETIPKVQCNECLLYWSQGIVYCTCGHLLKESEASGGAIQCALDLLSIQNYVIKKGRHHGHRYGKTKEQRDYHVAHNLRKRCIKRRFKGIHDRFQNDSTFRESLLSIDRTEEVRIQIDKDAQKDFTHRMTEDEYFRYKKELVDLSQYIWINWTDERSFRLQRSVDQVAPFSPRVWRRATCTDSLLAVSEMASVVLFIQHIMVAVERFLVELINSTQSSTSELVKERHVERRDPLCRFFKKRSEARLCNTFCLLQLDRLQLTAVCCNRRECEQHTSHVTFSHFFTSNDTHMRGPSHKFGVRTSHSTSHLHALMLSV